MGKMRSTLLEMFGGSDLDKMIGDKVDTALKESATGSTRATTDEDRGWTRITERDVKQFSPMDQYNMQRICYWLYDKNALGHRIIEREGDFVVGEGAQFSAEDPEVWKLLNKHWDDWQNNWDMKQHNKIKELGIYGEQFYPTFVNDSGFVRLGYLDPTLVSRVNTSPENAEKRISFKRKQTSKAKERTYSIINQDINPNNKTYEYLVGEAFFFSINNVSNMPRGRSDLFSVADGIDSFEQFLFNVAERAELGTKIIYDLLMKGKTEPQIKERLKKFKPPRSNEVYGHNENEELNMKVPDLSSTDFINTASLLFKHIMGGSGYPPHWFAWADNVVRATAMAMDLPTKKMLRTRQKVFKNMLSMIFRFQIHQAILHSTLSADKKDSKVTIDIPKIEEKETQIVAQSLVNVTNSLSIGVEEGWIDEKEAKQVYVFILNQLGKELNASTRAESQEEIDKKLKSTYEKVQQNLDRKKEAFKKKQAEGIDPEDPDAADE